MALFGTRPATPPPASAADAQLASLTARTDQAVARIDEALRPANRHSVRALTDALLDIRNALTAARAGEAT